MKRAYKIGAYTLAALAAILFSLPPHLFAPDPHTGLTIQMLLTGTLAAGAALCWHLART